MQIHVCCRVKSQRRQLGFDSVRFGSQFASNRMWQRVIYPSINAQQISWQRAAQARHRSPLSSPATWLKSAIPSQLARNSLGSTFGLTIGSCCCCCCLCWLTVLSAGQISVKCAHVWVCMCVQVCVCIGSICAPWMTNCAQGGFLFFSWFARFGLVFSWSTSRRRRVA